MKKYVNGEYIEMTEEEVTAWEEAQKEVDDAGGVITPYDVLGSGLFVGELIEEVTLEEDMIYSLSGEFRYLAIKLLNVASTSSTRLWETVNGASTAIGTTTTGYKCRGYIILKSDDYVKIAFSDSETWTNPMTEKTANHYISGNIKGVSISLGSNPGNSPLLAGTKITVYGIKA